MNTQLHQHTSELGRWQVAQRTADARLRAYVHGYFGSESHLPAAVHERHLPSTEVALFLNFGSPHKRLDTTDAKAWTSGDRAWVIGLHDSHRLTEAVGDRLFIVVRFTPIGAHLFLRLPMRLIANRAIDLEQLDPKLARSIWTRVGAAACWDDRFDIIEALIADRVTSVTAASAVAGAAWSRLITSHGRNGLGLLASEMDCSHRHLIAQFQACIGLPPKAIARLLRFNRAVQTLNRLSGGASDQPAGKPYIERPAVKGERVQGIRLVDVAEECGYFDQSHFTKEFRQFAGLTPAKFLRQSANPR